MSYFSQDFSKKKVYKVSEITKKIRLLLQLKLGELWVEGEVSNFRRQASGHCYFTLKDEHSQLPLVLFSSSARKVSFSLKDGIKIQVFGEMSVYEPRGNYQLIVRHIQRVGEGELQMRFLAIKKKLEERGIFDDKHKKNIPRFPKTVGIITSETGAVLRDIVRVIQRRSPWVRIILSPVRVQGEEAKGEVISALKMWNSINEPNVSKPDVLILARGGGSIEDLWTFNEGEVALEIFESKIPIICAIGHETDFTLADFASDLRASTPSVAGELAVQDGAEFEMKLESFKRSLYSHINSNLREKYGQVEHIKSHLLEKPARRFFYSSYQKIDELSMNFLRKMQEKVRFFEKQNQTSQRKFSRITVSKTIENMRAKLFSSSQNIEKNIFLELQKRKLDLEKMSQNIQAISPSRMEKHGYTFTYNKVGKKIYSSKDILPNEEILVQFFDGDIKTRVLKE